jgi:hypothetical protein
MYVKTLLAWLQMALLVVCCFGGAYYYTTHTHAAKRQSVVLPTVDYRLNPTASIGLGY